MEFLNLFDLLYKQQVRYLLCGGLAVNIYGVPRSTADIDILVDFEEGNINNFLTAMKVHSYTGLLPFSLQVLVDSNSRQKMISENNLIAYSFFNSRNNVLSLDVLVNSPLPFDVMWERKETRTIGQTQVYIVSIEDLIFMKNASGRTQDIQDIQLLSNLIR